MVKDLQAGEVLLGDLSQDCSNQENYVVGLGSDLEKIKDCLTHDIPKKLTAISIVGMGGIGKTTLARRLFDDPSIKLYFHICLWVTVSEAYHARKMLVSLLGGLGFACGDTELDHDLGEILYRKLIGRRYLIVMDDVWSTKALDEVRIYFPNNENGSRILLTTRLSQVSIYLNSEGSHHMNLLNEDDGWQLLCQKLFGKEKCPPKLQDIGRRIVTKCQGLPLAIALVAGYLRNISRTAECWTEVAETVTSHVTGALDIIGLSYNHLPIHLKPCFLYMGAFPADSEIPSQKLIRLWIAEGFLNQVGTKSLENVAEEWLEDLTQRHLILVRKGSHGRIKACHMHDLLRYFCLRETKKKNFLCHYPEAFHEGMNYPSRVIFHSYDSSFNLSTPHIHSLLCFQNVCADFFDRHKDFKLLMVLDFYVSRFDYFPSEIVQLVNLRYLALSIDKSLPPAISNLQNLQIFILRCYLGGTTLPWQIWNLPQLRHLHCIDSCFLPDPFHAANDGKLLLALSNLQTLSKLTLSCCTMPVFAALPNLKKLGICETEEACRIDRSWFDYDGNSDYSSISTTENIQPDLDIVAQLHQLETLKLIFLSTFTREPRRIPNLDALRPNLKKLTLSFSYLPWEYMNVLCMLHNLEVLKLKNYAFTGKEWKQHEEGFDRLKFLLLECTDLVHWKADKDCFPCLEHLVLKFCIHLETIPLDIGEIDTLKIIEVHGCTYFAAISAKEIQEEQQHMGYDALEVRISMAEQDIFADLQLEEGVSSSVVPCISEYVGPDSSGHHIPSRHNLQVKMKELMFLVLLMIVFWLISWDSISSNIKKLTLQGLIVVISWQTDLLTALCGM